MMTWCINIGRFIKLKNEQGTNGNNSNRNNKSTQGHKSVSGSLDAKIIEELLNDAFISSTRISKKHKAPLSTVQRRRRHLENTILTRRYEIDLTKQGFRIGEMTVVPQNGASEKIIGGIFSKYSNHILSITMQIDGAIILAVLVYFKTTAEIRDIMVGIHSMPGVENVRFAETVEIIRNRRNELGKTVARSIIG
jgi:DNA-binding Lrp family transcriptional regulator